MTGARVKRVQRYVDGDTFMATYGDGLADVDLGKVMAFHREHGKLATMTTMAPTSRFGMLEVDFTGKVTSFIEKPQLTSRPTPASSCSSAACSTICPARTPASWNASPWRTWPLCFGV